MSILSRIKQWALRTASIGSPPMRLVETPMDKLSNRALDAIEAGDYGKAEKLCRRLLREYPEIFDGHERLGMLREAQGRFLEAAQEYSKVLEMMKRDPEDVDEETVKFITEQRDQALAKAKG